MPTRQGNDAAGSGGAPNWHGLLIEAARAYERMLGTGVRVVCVKFKLSEGGTDCFHVPPQMEAPRPPVQREEDAGPRKRKCIDDVLDVLHELNTPLTGSRIKSELSRRGIEWSDRKVDDELARAVEEGTLLNDPQRRPKGYALPEWAPHEGRGPAVESG